MLWIQSTGGALLWIRLTYAFTSLLPVVSDGFSWVNWPSSGQAGAWASPKTELMLERFSFSPLAHCILPVPFLPREDLSLIHQLEAVSRCQNTLCFSAKSGAVIDVLFLGCVLQVSPCACSAGEWVNGKAAFSLFHGLLCQRWSWRVINHGHTAVLWHQQNLLFGACSKLIHTVDH